jgi:ATP-dependent RNA circularization protein (DNA/RNA ligase family)
MPYMVKGKCIYKKDTGKKVGCTKKSVQKYLSALHANIKENKYNMKNSNKTKLEYLIRRIVNEEFGYSENNPKIDIFYKDSKKKYHYLWSTKYHKTIKSAVERAKKSLENNATYMKAYSKKVGESIDINNIKGAIDKNKR